MLLISIILRAETKGWPRESTGWGWALARDSFGVLFAVFKVTGGITVVCAGGVIVESACRIRKGIVGVVYLLEFLCTGWALWWVWRNAIGMGFQGLSILKCQKCEWTTRGDIWLFVGISNLLLGGLWRYVENCICFC